MVYFCRPTQKIASQFPPSKNPIGFFYRLLELLQKISSATNKNVWFLHVLFIMTILTNVMNTTLKPKHNWQNWKAKCRLKMNYTNVHKLQSLVSKSVIINTARLAKQTSELNCLPWWHWMSLTAINPEVLTHFRGFGLQKYVNPPSLYFSIVLIQYAKVAFLKGA